MMSIFKRNRIIRLVDVALVLISIWTLYSYVKSAVNLVLLSRSVSNEKEILFYQATKARWLPFYVIYCLWGIFLGLSAISLFNLKRIGVVGCSLSLTVFILYTAVTIFYDPVGISTYLLIIGNLSNYPSITLAHVANLLSQKVIPIMLGALGIVAIRTQNKGSSWNSPA